MELVAADTTFLIDLQRDADPVRSSVKNFIQRHANSEFCVSITALGEFSAGFPALSTGVYLKLRQRFALLESDEGVALEYREIFRYLKPLGMLIGANDMWIAASALRHGAALVTRNAAEFSRIPRLSVLSY